MGNINMGFLLNNENLFTKSETSSLLHVFSEAFSSFNDKEEQLPQKLGLLNSMVDFLNKFYFSNLEATKETKSSLIQLIRKLQIQKEVIELSLNDNVTEEDFKLRRERLQKKMQSSVPSSFRRMLVMYLDGALSKKESKNLLIEVRNNPEWLQDIMKDKRFRDKLSKKIGVTSKEKLEEELKIKIQNISENS